MKKLWTVLTIMMVAILSFTFTSCNKEGEVSNEGGNGSSSGIGTVNSAIVGQWKATSSNGHSTVYYLFSEDGTAECTYYFEGSTRWREKNHIYTQWGLKGSTVTVTGGAWSSVDSDGNVETGKNSTVTFEYNGSTLTGGGYSISDDGELSSVVYHKI